MPHQILKKISSSQVHFSKPWITFFPHADIEKEILDFISKYVNDTYCFHKGNFDDNDNYLYTKYDLIVEWHKSSPDTSLLIEFIKANDQILFTNIYVRQI